MMRLIAWTVAAFACLLPVLVGPSAAAIVSPAAPLTPTSDALAQLYAARGGAPLWIGGDAAARREVMLALLAAEDRTDPAAPAAAPLAAAFALLAPADQQAAERALTAATLGYLARRHGGAPVEPNVALRALERLDGVDPAAPLALALAQLEIVRELGGWRPVGTVPGPAPTAPPLALVSPEIDVAPAFPKRKRLPEVPSLRRRLVQSGDLSATYLEGDEIDAHLVDAVRRFQARHGLAPDGVAGVRTIARLNRPIGDDIAQVRLNLARPQEDRSALPRYVEVNVPGFQLRLVEHGKVVLRSRVIVGDLESPTPIFDDRIRFIEINPYWYVPASIAAELTEKEIARPGYLERNGFYWRTPELLVQRPGAENALGRVKFLFPNHHAVYLHDTPERGMFSRSVRSLSHGCVRVEKPLELALALAAPQGWDQARLDQALAGQKTRRIDLDPPVPVFLDYRTAFVDDRGRLNLRPDLYGHDQAGITIFPDKGLPPPPPAVPLEAQNLTPPAEPRRPQAPL